jgi:hypothetical protein
MTLGILIELWGIAYTVYVHSYYLLQHILVAAGAERLAIPGKEEVVCEPILAVLASAWHEKHSPRIRNTLYATLPPLHSQRYLGLAWYTLCIAVCEGGGDTARNRGGLFE